MEKMKPGEGKNFATYIFTHKSIWIVFYHDASIDQFDLNLSRCFEITERIFAVYVELLQILLYSMRR
jgi:hypothetical protein